MMGGDGGLTNSLRAFKADNRFNLDLFYFINLPFGSGNDSARVFGWGATHNENHLQNLYYMCLEIAESSVADKQNIWDISVEMSDIFRVGEQRQDQSLKKSTLDTTYEWPMCITFSMGDESQVGFYVE
jgi:hypothetical protein